MKQIQSVGFILMLVWLMTGIAQDDPFVGYFSGELDGIQYQVTIERFSPLSMMACCRSTVKRCSSMPNAMASVSLACYETTPANFVFAPSFGEAR